MTHLASQSIITPAIEDDLPIQFLFRKQGRNRPVPDPLLRKFGFSLIRDLAHWRKAPTVEWTNKLASLADKGMLRPESIENSRHTGRPPLIRSSSTAWFGADHTHQVAKIGVRVEGPYFTPADPSRYHTVICIVAGTGVSGAVAIVDAFSELQRERAANVTTSNGCELGSCGASHESAASISLVKVWERCVVIWSVKAEDYIDIPFLKENLALNLEVHIHLTGKDRPRLDIGKVLADIHGTSILRSKSTWAYLSGPNPFIETAENACKASLGVEWISARWDI